jgi:hypothetical protein
MLEGIMNARLRLPREHDPYDPAAQHRKPGRDVLDALLGAG